MNLWVPVFTRETDETVASVSRKRRFPGVRIQPRPCAGDDETYISCNQRDDILLSSGPSKFINSDISLSTVNNTYSLEGKNFPSMTETKNISLTNYSVNIPTVLSTSYDPELLVKSLSDFVWKHREDSLYDSTQFCSPVPSFASSRSASVSQLSPDGSTVSSSDSLRDRACRGLALYDFPELLYGNDCLTSKYKIPHVNLCDSAIPKSEVRRRNGTGDLSESKTVTKNTLHSANLSPVVSHHTIVESRNKTLDSFFTPQSSPSPVPQSFKGDPQRRAKVKSELCLHYVRDLKCPFGDRCNYAHGMEDLKYTRIIDLKRAGLIDDITTYRVYPCPTFCSTGACPFGLRCINIHDKRIAGRIPSWLPHVEMPSSNIPAFLIIDKFYYHNLSSLHQENILVDNLLWNLRTNGAHSAPEISSTDEYWNDTYASVCNIFQADKVVIDRNCHDMNEFSPRTSKSDPRFTSIATTVVNAEGKNISELQRLCMAIMVGKLDTVTEIYSDFVYDPRHLIFNELCMLLETRYFFLNENFQADVSLLCNENESFLKSVVTEISAEEYAEANFSCTKMLQLTPHNTVVVRLLAFGPCGSASARVSLWFDIPSSAVVTCTPNEVKKIRRSSQKTFQLNGVVYGVINDTSANKNSHGDHASADLMMIDKIFTLSNGLFRFHPHHPFYYAHPIDSNNLNLHGLIYAILRHRVKCLYADNVTGDLPSYALDYLSNLEFELRNLFDNVHKSTKAWKWPQTEGRKVTTEDTPVPVDNVMYEACSENFLTGSIWNSFIGASQFVFEDDRKDGDLEVDSKNRLDIFRSLSFGDSIISSYDDVPHILSSNGKSGKNFLIIRPDYERAWKAILTKEEEWKDWEVIMNRYGVAPLTH